MTTENFKARRKTKLIVSLSRLKILAISSQAIYRYTISDNYTYMRELWAYLPIWYIEQIKHRNLS